jgi:hypothetical protein
VRRVAAALLCVSGVAVTAEACAGGVPVVLPQPGRTVVCAPGNAGHYATDALFKNTEYSVSFKNKAGANTYSTNLYHTPKSNDSDKVNGSGEIAPKGQSVIKIPYTSDPHNGSFIVSCPADNGSSAALYEVTTTSN